MKNIEEFYMKFVDRIAEYERNTKNMQNIQSNNNNYNNK